MTDVQNYFTRKHINSNTTPSSPATIGSPLTTPTKNDLNNVSLDSMPTSPFVLRAPPKANSKLILQNMEEVLNSVKEKHREKHKRKREQKRRAALLIEAKIPQETHESHVQTNRPQPLREKTTEDNGITKDDPCNIKAMRKSSILEKERKSKKPATPINKPESAKDETIDLLPGSKPKTPTNVFELMMKARCRSLGTNPNGQELTQSPTDDPDWIESQQKRKQMLNEWNERKGGAKRKLIDEARGEYIEQKMEQRAKRLKEMLTKPKRGNGQTRTSTAISAKVQPHSRTRCNSLDVEEPLQDIIMQHTTAEQTLKKVDSLTSSREGLLDYFPKMESPKEMLVKQEAHMKSEKTSRHSLETPKRRRGRPSTKVKITTELEPVAPVDTANQTPTDRPRRSCANKVHYEEITCEPEQQTESTPTRKRDSLLGYFVKVESPKESATETATPETKKILESPKRSSKRNLKPKTPALKEAQLDLVTQSQTPTSRPRRSCASAQVTPVKLEKAATTTVGQSETLIEFVDLDDDEQLATGKKLAPLFLRHEPKQCADPKALRARNEFLRSGIPSKLKREQSRQKQFLQCYEDSFEPFPRIAHVTQLSASERDSSEQNINLKFMQILKNEEEKEDIAMSGKLKCVGSITNCKPSDFQEKRLLDKLFAFTTLPFLENKRAIVKLWKTEFDRFPTFKCYNQMREKYRYFNAFDSAQDTTQVGESVVVTRRTRRSLEAQEPFDPNGVEETKPPKVAPNGELLYSEKYKPLLFDQVLVNLTPVQQLRDFLSNWNTRGNRHTHMSDDAAADTDDDSRSMIMNSNAMVLLGPCSSGKTNAVFALANDMNFNVLEINAGMKRSGKKLIQELQEATQSHQIRKDSKSASSTTPVPGGGAQQLLKLSLSKRQQGDVSDSNETHEPGQSVRKSLILIEDADILFENTDAGFTDAIYTLAASSKRPVIAVASDPHCAHLQRLMLQNTIHFHAPNALNISKFLSVLALIENCPTQLDTLISLYLYNDKNLRKTLMELQFYIQSGGDKPALRLQPETSSPTSVSDLYMHQQLFEFYTRAQNTDFRIPYPVDFHLLRFNLFKLMRASPLLRAQPMESTVVGTTKRKSRSPKKAWLNSATSKIECLTPMQTLASFYENISAATLLDARIDETSRLMPLLAEDIAHTLAEQAVTITLAAQKCAYNLFESSQECYTLCPQLGNYHMRSSSSRALDYEPAMRSICRSEKTRAGLERRSSRFYHYLRNYTANTSGFCPELCDAACSIFMEASDNERLT